MFFASASHDEARFLIEDHHYSGRMVASPEHIFCVRAPGGLFGDNGEAIAVAVFAYPACRFKLNNVLELSRVVNTDNKKVRTAGFVATCVRWLKSNTDNDLLISYADLAQGHHGGIYQAASWFFGGKRAPRTDAFIIDGEFVPWRSALHRYGSSSAKKIREVTQKPVIEHKDDGKFLYWFPLGNRGKRKARELGLQSLPYPKPGRDQCQPSVARN